MLVTLGAVEANSRDYCGYQRCTEQKPTNRKFHAWKYNLW